MGPKLRIQRGESTSCHDLKTKGPILYLDNVERFTFHLAVQKGLGSITRCVERETSPFEINRPVCS